MVSKQYTNTTLVISGSQLKLSDMPSKQERGNNSMIGKGQIIQFFAIGKIIIDRDLNEIGEEMNIVIIAPICEVEGFRKIILNGLDAPAHESPANNGTADHYNGHHGKLGLKGGRGGNFYGVCQKFVNGGNLSISTDGGNGGSGQRGGDGTSGTNCNKRNGTNDQKGEIGGRGGDGGAGGEGGKGGEIIMVIFDDPEGMTPKISALNGKSGFAGDGGKGGKDDKDSKNCDGENGDPGKSFLGFRFPLNNERNEFKFLNAVNDFKFYAQWYLLNSTIDTTFKSFFNILENHIVDNFTIAEFIDEYSNLEKLSFHLNNISTIVLKQFYQSLHERLKKNLNHTGRIGEILDNNLLARIKNLSQEKLISDSKLISELRGEVSQLKEEIKIRNEIRERVNQWEEILKVEKFLDEKFWRLGNFLSGEIGEKYENILENVEDSIQRFIDNWKNDNATKYKLEKKLEERFSLQSIFIAKLGIEFTLPMIFGIFVTNFYNLGKNQKNGIDGDLMRIPANVEEFYRDVDKRYENYINRRIGIIGEHINLVKKRRMVAKNDEDDEFLKNLASTLDNFLKNLTSFHWIKKEPFKWEIEILLEEERKLNLLSEHSADIYEIPLHVMRHLKLDSKCAQVLGESYEKFTKNDKLNKIRELILNMDFQYLEDLRTQLFEEIFPTLNDLQLQLFANDSMKVQKIRNTRVMITLDGFLNQIYMEISSIVFRDWHNGSYDFFAKDLRKAIEDIREMISKLFYVKRIFKDKTHLTSDSLLNYKWSLLKLHQQNNFIKNHYLEILAKFKNYPFNDVKNHSSKNFWIDDSNHEDWIEIFKINDTSDLKINRIDQIASQMLEELKEENFRSTEIPKMLN